MDNLGLSFGPVFFCSSYWKIGENTFSKGSELNVQSSNKCIKLICCLLRVNNKDMRATLSEVGLLFLLFTLNTFTQHINQVFSFRIVNLQLLANL